MGALSLRLPDELEQRLDAEARRAGIARSEVARLAIVEFLTRKERERFLSAFVAEARAGYGDPAMRQEALAIAEEALPLDNEALDLFERAYQEQAARTKSTRTRRKR